MKKDKFMQIFAIVFLPTLTVLFLGMFPVKKNMHPFFQKPLTFEKKDACFLKKVIIDFFISHFPFV